jgi:hypothetical protein
MYTAFKLITVLSIASASGFVITVFAMRILENVTQTGTEAFQLPRWVYLLALSWGLALCLIVSSYSLWVECVIALFAAPLVAVIGAAVLLAVHVYRGGAAVFRRILAVFGRIFAAAPSFTPVTVIHWLADRVLNPARPEAPTDRETP